MDLVLVNPGTYQKDSVNEHLGILGLRSFLHSKGYAVDVIDMAVENLDIRGGLEKVLEQNPGVLGISMLDETKQKGFALIDGIRKAGYSGKIVLGGYFPTFSADEILRDFSAVDFIVRGEGEITLLELMDHISGRRGNGVENIPGLSYRHRNRVISNPSRPLIADLDMLPPVDRKYARYILDKKRPLRVFSTRGCWGRCTFCDIINFYGTSSGRPWRRRSVNYLVDELENLVNRYNTNEFIFNDDQFLVKGRKSLDYVNQFADEISRRRLSINFDLMCRSDTIDRKIINRLKEAGLKRVFLGLESFDPKQLKRFNKGISVRQNFKALRILYQLKIDVIASVILADAYTSLYDLLKHFAVLFRLTRRYFNSKNCQISMNKKLEVYRGGRIYEEYKSAGILTRDDYLQGYDYKLKALTNLRLKLLSIEEILSRISGRVLDRIYQKFNKPALRANRSD